MATRTYKGKPNQRNLLAIADKYGMVADFRQRLHFDDDKLLVFAEGKQIPSIVQKITSPIELNSRFFSSLSISLSTITDIKWPASVSAIHSDAFDGMDQVSAIIGPSQAKYITEISGDTFKGLSTLKKVVLPNGISSIGQNAFTNCPKLCQISLPRTMKAIDSTSFDQESPISVLPPEHVVDFQKLEELLGPNACDLSSNLACKSSFYDRWEDTDYSYEMSASQEFDLGLIVYEIEQEDPSIDFSYVKQLLGISVLGNSRPRLQQAARTLLRGDPYCYDHHFLGSNGSDINIVTNVSDGNIETTSVETTCTFTLYITTWVKTVCGTCSYSYWFVESTSDEDVVGHASPGNKRQALKNAILELTQVSSSYDKEDALDGKEKNPPSGQCSQHKHE